MKLATSAANWGAKAPELQSSIGGDHPEFSINFLFWSAARHADGSFSCSLPEVLCARISPRFFAPPHELAKFLLELPQALFGHFSSAMFVLLPLFALYLKAVYSRRTYGEHFLFALHIHSLWFLVLLLALAPLPQIVQVGLLGYLLVFGCLSLQRVYGGPVWQTLTKNVVVACAHLASLIAVASLFGLWALLE